MQNQVFTIDIHFEAHPVSQIYKSHLGRQKNKKVNTQLLSSPTPNWRLAALCAPKSPQPVSRVPTDIKSPETSVLQQPGGQGLALDPTAQGSGKSELPTARNSHQCCDSNSVSKELTSTVHTFPFSHKLHPRPRQDPSGNHDSSSSALEEPTYNISHTFPFSCKLHTPTPKKSNMQLLGFASTNHIYPFSHKFHGQPLDLHLSGHISNKVQLPQTVAHPPTPASRRSAAGASAPRSPMLLFWR